MNKEEAIGILTYKVNMSNNDVYIGDLDKTNIEAIKVVLQEIDRLNDVIKGLREERDYLFNKTKIESKVEIDRLNNIIDELEEYLTNDKNICKRLKTNNEYLKGCHDEMQEILDKLKELKENNKK